MLLKRRARFGNSGKLNTLLIMSVLSLFLLSGGCDDGPPPPQSSPQTPAEKETSTDSIESLPDNADAIEEANEGAAEETSSAKEIKQESVETVQSELQETQSEPALEPVTTEPVVSEQAVPEQVVSEEAGKKLYAQHCTACHGQDGDGKGKAADFLFPKPRDFTNGRFRLVSTKNRIPTSEDLEAVLIRGMPGSAMLPFSHLKKEELTSLVKEVQRLNKYVLRY